VDQRGRLESPSWFLVGELLSRQLAQLVVDQRQKLLGRLGLALLNGRKDSGDLVHRNHPAS